MESLLNPAVAFVRSFDWQSPMAFVAIAAVWLMIIGRWGILLIMITTFVLGSVASNLIIMNIHTLHELIGVPTVIYLIGGVLAIISVIIGFIRYMLN